MESIPKMKEIHLKQILFSLVFSPFFHFISLNSSSFISLHMHCFCFHLKKFPRISIFSILKKKKSSADSQNDDSILWLKFVVVCFCFFCWLALLLLFVDIGVFSAGSLMIYTFRFVIRSNLRATCVSFFLFSKKKILFFHSYRLINR